MSDDPAARATARPSKGELRAELRARRRALTPEARAAAHEAIARALDARLAQARTVAVYAAQGSELDLATWIDRFVARGGVVAWPLVGPDGLSLAICPRSALAPGYRGILEPPPDAPRLDLDADADAPHAVDAVDVILVPGLGFDAAGHRLGQGGGFYDRLLAALRRRPRPPRAIGVGYALQRVAHVPVEPHDEPVDEVITDAGPILDPLVIGPAP
ncbi:MAG: 5-formyltetrahydrofolate cyclo-ligase [Myxococcota bacterium]